MMATSMDAIPAHLFLLAMEEFPQTLAPARICRGLQREPSPLCTQPCLFTGIIEEEEEGGSSLEEDQAQRSYLRALESLRRSTRGVPSKNS